MLCVKLSFTRIYVCEKNEKVGARCIHIRSHCLISSMFLILITPEFKMRLVTLLNTKFTFLVENVPKMMF
jgi:hypothetical protein